MDPEQVNLFQHALSDFYKMRYRADLERLLARLTGKSANLLSYQDIRNKLKAGGGVDRGIQDIPLDSIVGSVDRYEDFTRSFLPKRDDDAKRWAHVELATLSLHGLPPIEVFQIGPVYFVLDGNHRVSVARHLGATHIEAHVTEVRTKIPLTADIQPDELICKARLAEFLQRTHLDELRPGADLSVTAPGNYRILEEQIDVQRRLLSDRLGRDVSYEEAGCCWYDELYLPVVQLIEELKILHRFPNRTPTDLYAWISKHRDELTKALNWDIDPEIAAIDLVHRSDFSPQKVVTFLGEKIKDAITPNGLGGGPAPGTWRKEHMTANQADHLLDHILIPLNNREISWQALDQALRLAEREGGRLYGLHVVASPAQKEGEEVDAIKNEFQRRCEAAGFPSEFAVEVGGIARKIDERSRWSDIMVVGLSNPPADQPIARLNSGFGALVRRCSRPILAVPGVVSPLNRALVAYDGSRKAKEALFLATYLAGHWDIPIIVLTAADGAHPAPNILSSAQNYTEMHEIEATFLDAPGPAATAILKTATEQEADFVIMGGYGRNPLLEVVFGSTIDQVLQARRLPVLICR